MELNYTDSCPVAISSMRYANTEAETESLSEDGLQTLLIYPNPSSGSFTINYTIDADATLYIYDAQGKQVYSVVLTAQQKSIAVNNLNLANGVYMYKVLNSGNMLHNGKLIILKQ